MLVFSYHDESTVVPLSNIYKIFQEERSRDTPVLLVGTVGEGLLLLLLLLLLRIWADSEELLLLFVCCLDSW